MASAQRMLKVLCVPAIWPIKKIGSMASAQRMLKVHCVPSPGRLELSPLLFSSVCTWHQIRPMPASTCPIPLSLLDPIDCTLQLQLCIPPNTRLPRDSALTLYMRNIGINKTSRSRVPCLRIQQSTPEIKDDPFHPTLLLDECRHDWLLIDW
jgi:hypothetical protein